ncbi:hypothetical protein D9619_005090 [Psilocybe cf. subviscida]|uniref:Uncharacterized protein n=1 Tax=Psilocybe cf. subviscida TaxID=2480587 RepID=A0A8H5BR53_9AGAR|nr:hypothetical protein D9619_005090 [Psilocybe cf. subviscida]
MEFVFKISAVLLSVMMATQIGAAPSPRVYRVDPLKDWIRRHGFAAANQSRFRSGSNDLSSEPGPLTSAMLEAL